MKIALLGYGKMGQTINDIITHQMPQHSVVLRVDSSIANDWQQLLPQADVAIEFSQARIAPKHIVACFAAGVPVVCGTTGISQHDMQQLQQACEQQEQSFFWAANFSIGVHLTAQLTEYLAQLMVQHPTYQLLLTEIHHTQKLDAPSGTAIALAQRVCQADPRKTEWALTSTPAAHQIGIIAERLADVKGTHTLSYTSPVDTISLTHTAHSREGFALGAIQAAEWLLGKKGVFGMRHWLG